MNNEIIITDKKEPVSIILYKDQFKEVDVFQNILSALNKNPSDISIIISIPG